MPPRSRMVLASEGLALRAASSALETEAKGPFCLLAAAPDRMRDQASLPLAATYQVAPGAEAPRSKPNAKQNRVKGSLIKLRSPRITLAAQAWRLNQQELDSTR